MIWAVSPFPAKEPQAIELLLLTFGKSLYLASEFERKCQHVLRTLDLIETFEKTGDTKATYTAAVAAKDRLLAQTISGMSKFSVVTPDEIEDLTKAREARNYIAHEAGKIGVLHHLQARHIAEARNALRPKVIDLAKGDNVISVWAYEIQEKLNAPQWMTQTYEARVLNWIFGEPFRGISSWDEWALAQLAVGQKPHDDGAVAPEIRAVPPTLALPRMPPFNWHSDLITRATPVTASYRNTQKVRRFLRAECGGHFKFDRPFMAWMKSGAPKTMGDAADEWLRRARNKRP